MNFRFCVCAKARNLEKHIEYKNCFELEIVTGQRRVTLITRHRRPELDQLKTSYLQRLNIGRVLPTSVRPRQQPPITHHPPQFSSIEQITALVITLTPWG